ncbi:hypothetical protein FZEAL_4124 [Fusarium zealandicum]|uniref:Uncharacterized protein n=1 Tax=Fusarium zealandicum TaxID=1053134 RepID=A0A8H4UMX5_9HYPO|nr:hypothetical protein FZEAL_4124 [Fusarium zealandicum]
MGNGKRPARTHSDSHLRTRALPPIPSTHTKPAGAECAKSGKGVEMPNQCPRGLGQSPMPTSPTPLTPRPLQTRGVTSIPHASPPALVALALLPFRKALSAWFLNAPEPAQRLTYWLCRGCAATPHPGRPRTKETLRKGNDAITTCAGLRTGCHESRYLGKLPGNVPSINCQPEAIRTIAVVRNWFADLELTTTVRQLLCRHHQLDNPFPRRMLRVNKEKLPELSAILSE